METEGVVSISIKYSMVSLTSLLFDVYCGFINWFDLDVLLLYIRWTGMYRTAANWKNYSRSLTLQNTNKSQAQELSKKTCFQNLV